MPFEVTSASPAGWSPCCGWGLIVSKRSSPRSRRRSGATPKPNTCCLWSGTDDAFSLGYLRSDARDAARFELLLGAEDCGRVVAAAAWIPPEAYPVSTVRQARQLLDLLPSVPWGWRAAREAQRGRAQNRLRHRVHPEHFYLRVIGVEPLAQGQGLGASLVLPVLEMADARSVGCFLQTATIENVA